MALHPWAWLDADPPLAQVHCLEIGNDPSWPDNRTGNPDAVSLWTQWLNAGYRITAIGGSDYHRPGPPPNQAGPDAHLSLPSTYVYAQNLSGRAILNALRAHRAYVSMGPQLQFQAEANGQLFDIGAEITRPTTDITLKGHLSSVDTSGTVQIVKNESHLDYEI